MKEVYLDNAATTKVYEPVIEEVNHALRSSYGNPSSLHGMGIDAEKIIKNSRAVIAAKLQVDAKEIFFTSGGTESNNLAIKGAVNSLNRYGNRIITSSIEHPSVLNVFKGLERGGYDVKYLGVNQSGLINLKELEEYLNDDTILVSIMGVNNEIGSIQPLAEIGELISAYDNLYFHVDGVQTFTKVDSYPAKANIDLYSISSHKLHGPKGSGALYIKKGSRIDNLLAGSKQESGLRPGTENVPGIAGFGKAVQLAPDSEDLQRMQELKEALAAKILKEIEETEINGPKLADGAPHILNISFAEIKGEVLVHSLERDNIYLSTGAACSSRQETPSYVLEAIGTKPKMIAGAIRFSLSSTTTLEEIDYTVDKLKAHVKMLRKIMKR